MAETRGRRPQREGAPHGQEAVRASLIAAAGELFAERGPANVSVRQVAEAAGVNHGLVHTYFGSKDGLVGAVLDTLADQAVQEVREGIDVRDLDDLRSATRRHGRILAHLILEGRDLSAFKRDFPVLDALVKRCREEGMSLAEARARSAEVAALVMGWQLFEPFLTAAAGIDPSPKQRQKMIEDAVLRLLR